MGTCASEHLARPAACGQCHQCSEVGHTPDLDGTDGVSPDLTEDVRAKSRIEVSLSPLDLKPFDIGGNGSAFRAKDDTKAATSDDEARSNGSDDRSIVSIAESVGDDELDATLSDGSEVRTKKRRFRGCLKLMNTMGFVPSAALLVVPDCRSRLEDNYELTQTLGKGSFGVVKKANVKATGAHRAVKMISKEAMKEQRVLLKQEIEIMKMLDHPNVVMLIEIFEDEELMNLVLELCIGGDLEAYMIGMKFAVPEDQTALATRQVVRAVHYLHSKDICHRDLKAANCLLVHKRALDLQNALKVSDFGLSVICRPKQVLVQVAGTSSHMAPEVFKKQYNKVCDVWSCGVMLFWMLSGELPFGKAGAKESNMKPVFGSAFVSVSQKAVDLCNELLNRIPKRRITPMNAMHSEWIRASAPKPTPELVEARHVEYLTRYRGLNKLKRAALNIIACMLDESETGPSRRLFDCLDEDGDGTISMPELVEKVAKAIEKSAKSGLRALRRDEAEKMFLAEGNPANGLKDFSYTEFVAATFDRRRCLKEKVCRTAFNIFDKNGDGAISISEMAQGKLLGHLDPQELIQTLQALDTNGDKEIDFKEFVTMLRTDS